ncbi:MAG: putative Phosphoribosyltransferase [Candidatus Saccharibacteria bacterium]|nr:putative Phosphoribosyltransferase [Candidatus Saccharibacteria bacterium]
MSLIDTLTSLFAPDDCLSCRREGSLLCGVCAKALHQPPGTCFECYAAIDGIVCSACLQRSGCGSITAAADYQGVAKQLVASLKFLGNQSAAKVMAERMMNVYAPPPDTLVIHMPATAQHIRQRGYDQAALLAKQIVRLSRCSRASLLVRHGRQHQLGSDRRERLTQLQNVLHVKRQESIQGRHVLLVDDVLATGASVKAATAALLGAGAARVDVLVFAQSIGKREGLYNLKPDCL